MKPNVKLVREGFLNSFKYKCDYVFSSGGRFEIIGNHTDHNHGKCLAATCNLGITIAVSPRGDNKVCIFSDQYGEIQTDLSNLDHMEKVTSSGEIIKGIAKYFSQLGHRYGGFNGYSISTIYPGAGVSSSAAFELLIGKIFNDLYNNGKVPTLEMCKAGQYSENNYYEKQSGLLDQIGAGYGNIVSIDFKNVDKPKIEKIGFPFPNLHFVLVNTGGSHEGLNDLYSSIPQDMFSAANKMGHKYLRDVSLKEFNSAKGLTETEQKRSLHFFSENERVTKAINAIKNNDEISFLEAINESRLSSTLNLKNMMVDIKYEGSPLQACDRAMKILGKDGACKINGGGFAGSIICIVKSNKLEDFIKEMQIYYGLNGVTEIFVREIGPTKE